MRTTQSAVTKQNKHQPTQLVYSRTALWVYFSIKYRHLEQFARAWIYLDYYKNLKIAIELQSQITPPLTANSLVTILTKKVSRKFLGLNIKKDRKKTLSVHNKRVNWRALKSFIKVRSQQKKNPKNTMETLNYIAINLKPKNKRTVYNIRKHKVRDLLLRTRRKWLTVTSSFRPQHVRKQVYNDHYLKLFLQHITCVLMTMRRGGKIKRWFGGYKKPRLVIAKYRGCEPRIKTPDTVFLKTRSIYFQTDVSKKMLNLRGFPNKYTPRPCTILHVDVPQPLIVIINSPKFVTHSLRPPVTHYTTNKFRNTSLQLSTQVKHNTLLHIFSLHRGADLVNSLNWHKHLDNNALLNIKVKTFGTKSAPYFYTLSKIDHSNNYLKTWLINSHLPKHTIQHSTTNFYPLTYFLDHFSATRRSIKKSNSAVMNVYYTFVRYNFKDNKFKNFYVFFLVNFLEQFLQKKIWVRVNTQDVFSTYWRGHLRRKLSSAELNINLYFRFVRLIPITELCEIIVIMFVTRDPHIFLYFLKNCFERSHFKKHKKILSVLFDILRKNKDILVITNIKGFFFDIRGKVGVSGNAKKRHLSFSINKITTTSQNVRSEWQQLSIWTPTGQMGMTCYILY